MEASAVPAKFNIPWAYAAGSSYIRAIPQASQIGITPNAASLTDGFPPLPFQPGGAPSGMDFNGILKWITQWNQWQGAGALVKYDPTFSAAIGGYPVGTFLAAAVAGSCWLSTVDNNTTDPDTGGAGWVQLTGTININAIAADVQDQTWIYCVDSGTADALVLTPSPAVTLLTPGLRLNVKKAANPNATTTPTANINSLGAKTIVRADGSSIQPNDLPAYGFFDLEYDGTALRLLELPPSAVRIRLTANQTFYVATTGSDSTGNGTSGSPWATLQHAFQAVYETYDLAGYTITFQVANGTYTSGLLWDGLFLGQVGPIYITGNHASPGSVIINVTGGPCFHHRFGCNVFLDGFMLRCGITSLGTGALCCEFGGYIGFQNLYFDACLNTYHQFSNFGTIFCDADYWISGGAYAHHYAQLQGNIDCSGATIVLSGTPAFTTFCQMNGGNVYAVGASYTGSCTGQRYLGQYGGLLNTGGGGVNFFPGNSAGSNPSGYYV
jgi:hypothetical protein